jgi:hypothetical protein
MTFRNLQRLAGALAALAVWAAPSAGGDVTRPAAVVELFTSQGCNSCPPADALLEELAKKGEVVALAYHVDYWDYLGWRDTMGSPENTARQQEYKRALGAASVYTPQAVINGRTHVNGADRAALERAIRNSDGLPVQIRVMWSGDSVVIHAGEAKGPITDANLMLVFFDEPKKVRIGGGENGGRTITYWNAVTGVQPAGMWHGTPARFEMPASEIAKKGAGGCAVLLQETDHSGAPRAIIGAALIENRRR